MDERHEISKAFDEYVENLAENGGLTACDYESFEAGWQAARAQQAGSGEAVAWDSPAVDPIVTKLYRRFKEWSQRGFTADDVTWCEVRKDVADMLNATAHPSASVPDRLLYVEDGGTKKDHFVNGWNECIDEMLTSRPYAPEGYTPVRSLVLKWMLGETEAFEPVEGERGQFWWRKRLREAMLPTDTTPQPDYNWIKCSERLPTESDGDDTGAVWAFDCRNDELEREYLHHVHCYTHWKPTGLKRPNPPAEREGE